MGDFNAEEDWKSTQLYLGNVVHENGKTFQPLASNKNRLIQEAQDVFVMKEMLSVFF